LIEAARNELQWRGVAKRMLHVWGDGMAWLRSAGKQPQFKGLERTIEAAGLFAPEPAECAREVIGHSPCLTKRH
jgi:serine/threonine-protein kinase HipA